LSLFQYSQYGLDSTYDGTTGVSYSNDFVPSRGAGRTVWVQAAEAGNLSKIISAVIL
jgi:hypothetical protein